MKTKYLLPCSCGQDIPVEATQAGDTIACACGESVAVPALRELTSLPRAEPTAPTQFRRPTAAWGGRQRRLLLGAVIALIGLILLSIVYYRRPILHDVKEMRPLQTWTLWQELRLGADRRPSPGAKEYTERATWYRRWVGVTATLTAVGVLLMASSFVSRRRRPGPGVAKRS